MSAIATLPTGTSRQPMTEAERGLLGRHLARSRTSVRRVLRLLPWAGGLVGVGAICAIAAWQTGIVGKILFGIGSLFFLWPVPSVFRANRQLVGALTADLAAGEVDVHAGRLARRYLTRGRHGHGRIVLDSGLDYAVPVTLLQAMTEDEPVTLHVAPASGCLLSVLWHGQIHPMPLDLDDGGALH